MGKLALYGALGGIGKGLNIEATRRAEAEAAEKKDSRYIQLERQRNRAADERQDKSDRETANREKARYGPGGYAEVAAKHAQGIATTKETSRQAHEIQIEEMRQAGEVAKSAQRITEKEKPFIYNDVAASTVATAEGLKSTPARTTVTDRATNVTYTQVGLAFVPEGWESPTKAVIQDSEKLIPWLLESRDMDTARRNSLMFLRLYEYLPAEYFSKFGGRGPVTKITEKGSTTTKTPFNSSAFSPSGQ